MQQSIQMQRQTPKSMSFFRHNRPSSDCNLSLRRHKKQLSNTNSTQQKNPEQTPKAVETNYKSFLIASTYDPRKPRLMLSKKAMNRYIYQTSLRKSTPKIDVIFIQGFLTFQKTLRERVNRLIKKVTLDNKSNKEQTLLWYFLQKIQSIEQSIKKQKDLVEMFIKQSLDSRVVNALRDLQQLLEMVRCIKKAMKHCQSYYDEIINIRKAQGQLNMKTVDLQNVRQQMDRITSRQGDLARYQMKKFYNCQWGQDFVLSCYEFMTRMKRINYSICESVEIIKKAFVNLQFIAYIEEDVNQHSINSLLETLSTSKQLLEQSYQSIEVLQSFIEKNTGLQYQKIKQQANKLKVFFESLKIKFNRVYNNTANFIQVILKKLINFGDAVKLDLSTIGKLKKVISSLFQIELLWDKKVQNQQSEEPAQIVIMRKIEIFKSNLSRFMLQKIQIDTKQGFRVLTNILSTYSDHLKTLCKYFNINENSLLIQKGKEDESTLQKITEISFKINQLKPKIVKKIRLRQGKSFKTQVKHITETYSSSLLRKQIDLVIVQYKKMQKYKCFNSQLKLMFKSSLLENITEISNIINSQPYIRFKLSPKPKIRQDFERLISQLQALSLVINGEDKTIVTQFGINLLCALFAQVNPINIWNQILKIESIEIYCRCIKIKADQVFQQLKFCKNILEKEELEIIRELREYIGPKLNLTIQNFHLVTLFGVSFQKIKVLCSQSFFSISQVMDFSQNIFISLFIQKNVQATASATISIWRRFQECLQKTNQQINEMVMQNNINQAFLVQNQILQFQKRASNINNALETFSEKILQKKQLPQNIILVFQSLLQTLFSASNYQSTELSQNKFYLGKKAKNKIYQRLINIFEQYTKHLKISHTVKETNHSQIDIVSIEDVLSFLEQFSVFMKTYSSIRYENLLKIINVISLSINFNIQMQQDWEEKEKQIDNFLKIIIQEKLKIQALKNNKTSQLISANLQELFSILNSLEQCCCIIKKMKENRCLENMNCIYGLFFNQFKQQLIILASKESRTIFATKVQSEIIHAFEKAINKNYLWSQEELKTIREAHIKKISDRFFIIENITSMDWKQNQHIVEQLNKRFEWTQSISNIISDAYKTFYLNIATGDNFEAVSLAIKKIICTIQTICSSAVQSAEKVLSKSSILYHNKQIMKKSDLIMGFRERFSSIRSQKFGIEQIHFISSLILGYPCLNMRQMIICRSINAQSILFVCKEQTNIIQFLKDLCSTVSSKRNIAEILFQIIKSSISEDFFVDFKKLNQLSKIYAEPLKNYRAQIHQYISCRNSMKIPSQKCEPQAQSWTQIANSMQLKTNLEVLEIFKLNLNKAATLYTKLQQWTELIFIEDWSSQIYVKCAQAIKPLILGILENDVKFIIDEKNYIGMLLNDKNKIDQAYQIFKNFYLDELKLSEQNQKWLIRQQLFKQLSDGNIEICRIPTILKIANLQPCKYWKNDYKIKITDSTDKVLYEGQIKNQISIQLKFYDLSKIAIELTKYEQNDWIHVLTDKQSSQIENTIEFVNIIEYFSIAKQKFQLIE